MQKIFSYTKSPYQNKKAVRPFYLKKYFEVSPMDTAHKLRINKTLKTSRTHIQFTSVVEGAES